jgi:ribonuclease G
MSKEMFVSLTPHETKVAVNEDDLLAEIYFERENEYTLAGSIYQGRVTRVLPGMQSAFVDVGLERDAFLYVSDFLELEDEDEQVEAIRVPPPPREPRSFDRPERQERPERPSRPERQERVEAAPVEPEAYFTHNHQPSPPAGPPTVFEGPEGFDEEQRKPETAAEPRPAQPAPGDREDRGGWRGRRGRRGRRSRPLSDDKVTRTEEAPRESHEQPREQPREPRPQRPDRDSYGPPPGYQPILLPGESISKYQRFAHSAPPPAVQPASAHDEVKHEAQVSTPPYAEPEASPQAGEADHFAVPADRFEQQHVAHEPSVIEPPAFQQEYVEPPVTEAAQPVAEKLEDTHAFRETRYQPYHEPEQPNEQERLDQMNIATVFGGVEATRAEVPTEDAQPAAEESLTETHDVHASAGSDTMAESASATHEQEEATHLDRHVPGFSATPHGSFEEELIEEEEADLPTFGEHDDVADFEELEEETLEPLAGAVNGEPVGEMLTEAVKETDQEEALEGYEADENGNGYDDAEEAEEDEEGEGTSAELRGPSGTAGFQQRTQRPAPGPGFDRQRGRRGGRRTHQRVSVQRQQVQIGDILKEGQEILVQIAKEPIGKKGARITSHIALPGRFMVFMPTVNHIGVSRKIASDEERQRLKRIVGAEREGGHGGFIVRTAAENVSEEDLRQDIRFLKGLWNEIKTRAETSKSPALIYHDLNLVERLLRDLLNEDFSHVWVDNEAEYERILRFVNRFQPNLVRRVRLYTKETPLFEQFGIQDEINKALKSKVWLKSGGYIVINQTEALVAIDVNTGKYVGKTTRLEDTIVKTNVDAINEIVRQIRLRDLGGIIVIDFIDMDERRNRQKVMMALEEALKGDRAPSKVLQFNDFGLVAITRKRVKHSLERTLGQPCPICTGTGLVKSVETVCNEIYVEMKKLRRNFEGREIMLRVNPEVAKALKGNNARWLNDLEELTGKTIIVKSDPSLHPEQFDM